MSGIDLAATALTTEYIRHSDITGYAIGVRRQVSSFISSNPINPYPINPVSYTHLDVYKRQDGAQQALGAPVANVLFFAGEATDISGHNGTVHGAIASGYRAAEEILQRRR